MGIDVEGCLVCGFFFETQRHRGTEAQRDLRELCDSVFPKSAQGRLFGLWVFFLKHRDTEAQREGRGG